MNERDTIKKALSEVIDPSSEETLGTNDAIRYIGIEDEDDKKTIVLIDGIGKDDDKTKQKVKRSIAKILKLDLGYQGVKVEFELLKKKDSILDDDKKIKYIGEGYCLWERLEHWDDELGPHVWNYFKYQKGPYKKSKRKKREKELIKEHNPPLNVQHNR